MNHIVTDEHIKSAERFRELLAKYMDNEDLINIGAYKRGSSKEIDESIQKYPEMISFLKQSTDEAISKEESIKSLIQLMGSA